MAEPQYKRVLLKVSGEALAGDASRGLDFDVIGKVCDVIKKCTPVSYTHLGLIKAVGTYKPAKNIKLATYASRCIENEILMHLRQTANLKSEVSFDAPLNTDWDLSLIHI